ncbi:uncharacterized protein Z520_00434 [Fonsecaea multimorphosa CBS 102226]|uniref:Uncharacterized protein n=1 Tax=Fonsecaea multimorphosa CBS 102226 TaxID=1442371 RepID=A0A0D2KC59_9EURO|nr:uncharacterized protein Z520_00434 [Fonsecaea multimorphosa CBS 102226]KIY03743.1 hypothetical protein Z520_00434 [Fonsecaea multimorphosa CBS 102226]
MGDTKGIFEKSVTAPLSPANIERSQRLDAYLQDKGNKVLLGSTGQKDIQSQPIISTIAQRVKERKAEKELERFMDSLSDQEVIEGARKAWQDKK